jgi:hypothetical protein
MQPFCPEDALSANTSNRCTRAEPCIADPFAEDFEFGNGLDVESFSETHEAHSDHLTVLACETRNGRLSALASHAHMVPSALSRAPTAQTLATSLTLAASTRVANISEIHAPGAQPQVQKRLRQVDVGCLADNAGSIDCVEANAKRQCLASSRVSAGDESSQSLACLSLWPETDDAITKAEVIRRAACILSTVLDVNDPTIAPVLQGRQREACKLSCLNPHRAATANQECTAFYSDIISGKTRLRQSGIDTGEIEMFSRGGANSMSSYLRYLEFEALILRSKLERRRMACMQNHKVSSQRIKP